MRFLLPFLLVPVLFGCKPHPKPLTKAQAERQQPAIESARLKWNLKTTVEDYERAGSKSGVWNDDAKEALTLFAQRRSRPDDGENDKDFNSVLRKLKESGCTDPMITYLSLRNTIGEPNRKDMEGARQYEKVAQQIVQSGYSPIRKFYVSLRAAEAMKYINGSTPNEFYPLRANATQYLQEALQDKSMPIQEGYEACRDFIAARLWPAPAVETAAAIQPLAQNWPHEMLTFLSQAEHEIALAWLLRGGGYAGEVKEDQWKAFAEHIDKAEAALKEGWSINQGDARVPTQMLEVAICKSYSPADFDLWFNRAMKLEPNDIEACKQKMRYLEPRWFGSTEKMLAFGRECISSDYTGRVPLVMLDVHEDIAGQIKDERQRKEYWKQADVWKDIKDSFEKFFALNPEAYGWRHNYAWYAYRSEQWDAFNEQLNQFPSTNFSYFGGQEAFEKMVKLAHEKSGK